MTFFKHLVSPTRMSIAQAATVLVVPAALLCAALAQAQTIYRCPSSNGITPYTNDKAEADRQGCTPMTGGNVTVVQGTKVAAPAASPAAAPVRVAAASQAGSRIDSAEQRSRDSDSRSILESELKKAEAKQAELLKEYNNGEPEKRGPETQNHQKYIERVAEMKAAIARNDSDIAGIKRELVRSSSTARAQ